MITVNEAIDKILRNTGLLPPVEVPLHDSLGRTISKNITAAIDYPPFDNSAMDGFVIFSRGEKFKIAGEIKAGDNAYSCAGNEALRIFTGAPVPEGVYTVIPVEDTIEESGFVSFTKEPGAGMHIREKASIIKKGDIALEAGTVITAGTIGFLSSQGIAAVMVYPTPRVSIIITGNELVQAGQNLSGGHIYESNSIMLQNSLLELNIKSVDVYTCRDEEDELKRVLKVALITSDILIITGGISVGKYDLVKAALTDAGVTEVFHKINQKPGKPMYFGTFNQVLVFGLPGNPASALTCFHVHVQPALQKMTGNGTVISKPSLPTVSHYSKKDGKTHFLRAKLNENGLELLADQNSNSLRSFPLADVLAIIPEGENEISPGDYLEVVPIFTGRQSFTVLMNLFSKKIKV